MKNFALIGAAGYIAPRHMKAIQETGNRLVAAMDKFDSVGVLDSYFPEADFFTEFERFERHLEKLRRQEAAVDYLSVCSPNYLHDSHIRFGLKMDADVICEKPLVLNPWNLDALQETERETGRKVFTILQLRHHPAIMALREKVAQSDRIHDVDLTYITARGHWYHSSWKGDESKSGGIATNIGIHFFDMLLWIFGGVKQNILHLHKHDRAAGYLELEKARVRWFLSINSETLPKFMREKNRSIYRSITVDSQEIEFSEGFTDLHTESYRQILTGKGFGLAEARNSIEVVHDLRQEDVVGLKEDYHPFARLPLAEHPFGKTQGDEKDK